MHTHEPVRATRCVAVRRWSEICLLAVAATACAIMLWAAGIVPAGVAVALLATTSMVQIRVLLAFRAVLRPLERIGRRGIDPKAPIEDIVSDLASRLEALDHRTGSRHPITGLALREHLLDAIEQGSAHGQRRLLAALRFSDHDRISTFDQAAAHQALAAIATRLSQAASRDHLVAQVDRDCFAIWFAGLDDVEAAHAELRALIHPLTQELTTSAMTIRPAIEVGTATFPDDGTVAGLLLMRALAARSQPQLSDNGAMILTRAPAAADARELFVLEQGLAQAIAEEQLTMLFQPLVDVAERRVVGAEALLRWHHPELGAISPARFIPMVEATGLSDRYGAWVLNAACREIRRWQDAGLRDVRVAVNLSACQLGDPALRDKIERTLARHRLSPHVLELELTETAAMVDAARTLRLFSELHDLGIALAIDDFGTGHSSLSYLKNLPFDKLKIDREFVTRVHEQPGSQAICRALIELSGGLNLRVLAEGVECRAEMETLARLGCSLFQGYYFSRPITGAEFLAFASDPAGVQGIGPAIHSHLSALQGRLSA